MAATVVEWTGKLALIELKRFASVRGSLPKFPTLMCEIIKKDLDKLEELTKVPTLEEVKKEWEELGYEWIDNCDFIELLNKSKEELFVIDTIHKKFAKSDDKVKFTLYVTFKEHELITKTFKMLGWEE